MPLSYVCCISEPVRLVEVPRRVELGVQLLGGEPVAQVGEPVLGRAVVDVVPVLAADLLQHLEEVEAAARVEGGDGPVLLAVLEPGAAGGLPGRPRHERGDVLVVVFHGRVRGHDGLDALLLAFHDDLGHILGDVLAQSEDASVSDRSVRAKESFGGCVSQ